MRETVVSAHICSGDELQGRARSSRGVTWNGAFFAFYSGFEDILKQAFGEKFEWMTTSQLLAISLDGKWSIAETHPRQKTSTLVFCNEALLRKISLYSMCPT